MANLDAPFSFRLYRGTDGFGFSLEEGTVASNVGLKIGDPLAWAAGVLTLATTQAIVGIAMQPVTATVGVQKTCNYRPATGNDVYIVQANGTFVIATHVGNDYDLQGTSGVVEVNLGGTTHKQVRVIGLAPGSAVGADARVLVNIRESGWTGNA